MKTERDLVDSIFRTALEGCGGDVAARRNAIWLAATTLLSDVLLNSDPFTRARLLRDLVAELREGCAHLGQLLSQPEQTVH